MTTAKKDVRATLSQVFQSAARKAVTVFAGLTLSFSALAQEAAPAASSASLTVTELKTEVSRTPIGKALVDYADSAGVVILFDENVAGERSNLAAASYDADTIRLKPDLTRMEQIVTLVHEMRHMMQDDRLGYYALEDSALMKPGQRWTQRRFVEADAVAFSAFFWADRMHRLQQDGAPLSMLTEFKMAHDLLKEMQGDGLTPDEYRKLAFEPALAALSNYMEPHLNVSDGVLRYLDGMLFMAEMMIREGMYDEAEKTLQEVCDRRARAPDDKEFEKLMRGYGGTDVAMNGPTCLELLSAKILLEDYPQAAPQLDRDLHYPEILAGRLAERNAVFEKLLGILDQMQEKLTEKKMAQAMPPAPPPSRHSTSPPSPGQ